MNAITRSVGADYGAVVVDMWNHRAQFKSPADLRWQRPSPGQSPVRRPVSNSARPFNDRDNLLSADRIHFSTSGQAVMATEVVQQLAHVLSRRR
jgi:lysophospholipase L1-like esterase